MAPYLLHDLLLELVQGRRDVERIDPGCGLIHEAMPPSRRAAFWHCDIYFLQKIEGRGSR